MSNERALRVAQSIKRELADMLRRDLKDPRLSGLISFTEVEVTSDLRNVKAFVSVFGTATGGAATLSSSGTSPATTSNTADIRGKNAGKQSGKDEDQLAIGDDDDDFDIQDEDDFDDEDEDEDQDEEKDEIELDNQSAKKNNQTGAKASASNRKPAQSQARGRGARKQNNAAELSPAERATQNVLECLNEESGYIRGELCRRLKLRFAPELVFLPDISLERGSKVSEILAKISRGEV